MYFFFSFVILLLSAVNFFDILNPFISIVLANVVFYFSFTDSGALYSELSNKEDFKINSINQENKILKDGIIGLMSLNLSSVILIFVSIYRAQEVVYYYSVFLTLAGITYIYFTVSILELIKLNKLLFFRELKSFAFSSREEENKKNERELKEKIIKKEAEEAEAKRVKEENKNKNKTIKIKN